MLLCPAKRNTAFVGCGCADDHGAWLETTTASTMIHNSTLLMLDQYQQDGIDLLDALVLLTAAPKASEEAIPFTVSVDRDSSSPREL
jgi:hypothetical protein